MDHGHAPGIRGTLVSGAYASRHLTADFAACLGNDTRHRARRDLAGWWRRDGVRLGPASSLRSVLDSGAAPVCEVLGFRLSASTVTPSSSTGRARATGSGIALPIVVTAWGENLDGLFARAVARGDHANSTWALGFNGRVLRLWDASRGWMRVFLDFDLETVLGHPHAFLVFWALTRAEALASHTRAVAAESDRHGQAIRMSLREGVRESLALLVAGLTATPRRARTSVQVRHAYEQALTVIYRVLFLLFAESRGLVPTWHPVYRHNYALESLRTQAEQPGRRRGLWAALQAASRLAHAGCRAGDLVVTAFNGRLFAPALTPIAESSRVDDETVGRAIVALTTHPCPHGRERIAFSDLGVEQLGAIYESVLDYEPQEVAASRSPAACAVRLAETRQRRKSSGTFYTPREMTDYVVRQALAPLVTDATPEQILRITVLDPAMGSGAFLVAACHFLSTAYERAVVHHRGTMAGDVTDADRAGFRRLVAQHCLYGVDVNPMAVQVARLSLWLATLAAHKPLTFLDHHLATGNSLAGASLDDVAGRPPGQSSRRRLSRALPLFPADDVGPALHRLLPLRHRLASVPDSDAAIVRDKERLLARLAGPASDLAAWKRAADVWCAGWLWDEAAGPRPSTGEFADMITATRGQRTRLPTARVNERLAHVGRLAREHQFFHWTLEFPEVFYQDDGTPRHGAGFDAVVTNPPWEMIRADSGPASRRAAERVHTRGFRRFVRDSGLYPACDSGHTNLYQLFVERSLALTRPGGRVGMIVPWGLASDHGSQALRQRLLQQCDTDVMVGFDNAAGIFPIHRGVRFLLLSTSPGTSTRRVRCYFGHRDPAVLDALAGGCLASDDRDDEGVSLSPAFLRRTSGTRSAFPYLRSAQDQRLLERLCHEHPVLTDPGTWALAFGRELNATDDRHLMRETGPGMPVLEGKDIEPFVVHQATAARRVPDGSRLPPDVRKAVTWWRLAYRDVAASTNRLTLIAALVPPGVVTVHSLFCLKTVLPVRRQAYLCAMLNSFVANYLVRLWVTTHLGASLVGQLPVPMPEADSDGFNRLADIALAIAKGQCCSEGTHVEAQTAAARLYGLNEGEYARVLETFPLVDSSLRQRCLDGLGTAG